MSRSIRYTGRLAGGGKMAITNDTARQEEKRRDDARGDSVIFKLGEILHRIIAFDVLDSWLPTSASLIHELVTKIVTQSCELYIHRSKAILCWGTKMFHLRAV